jgi:hypothetical protein
VLSAIFHVVEHFSGHTYQIILLTKRFTRKDLGFYALSCETERLARAILKRKTVCNGLWSNLS